jgi:hypothetical protein
MKNSSGIFCSSLFAHRGLLRLILILGVILIVYPADGQTIELQSNQWKLSIEPRTLEVTATPSGSAAILLSAAGKDRGPVSDLISDSHHASWNLPVQNLSVDMRADQDAFVVQFHATSPGTVSWPLLDPSKAVQAYILPMFEGLYVPAADHEWANFLEKQGSLNTTGDLSMPFIGLDCSGKTVTYILTNPFNNDLSFLQHNGNLSASLTHTFTPRSTAAPYGLRITLGGSSPIEPAKIYRNYLLGHREFVTLKQKIEQTPDAAKLLGAAHAYLWGDGLSPKMIKLLADAGIDRLWLGSPDWDGLRNNPKLVPAAIAAGYLIGPYDSYHTIHSPRETDTWETAQFNQQLCDTGGVVLQDGTNKAGFKHKGYILSPLAARPFVEKRVSDLMRQFQCNSWFIDCDATGEVFDDYSRLHPATQQEDTNARISRLTWIRDTFKIVIGSEGGSAYAASTLHFAHGIITPVIGWGDPELTHKSSPYYLGGYYPPTGPAVFFKQTPMKPEYRRVYADPQFRIPLYETVFHDSIVATHQWGYGSLKFTDDDHARELLELLYNVPPLYHLNIKEWSKRKNQILAHYQFFSPLHRRAALLRMTDFCWLTDDHMVQRTIFGDQLEMISNFRAQPYRIDGTDLPGQSIRARWIDSGQLLSYSPPGAEH